MTTTALIQRIEADLAALKASLGTSTTSPYLTPQQAAAYLGITYGSFRKIATKIRRTKTKRYTAEALDRYAAGQK